MVFAKDQLPEDRAKSQPPADIQAILTVIGRRTRTWGNGETEPLDLVNTNLQGANLWKAQLQRAFLAEAQLQGADLRHAQLQEANLTAVANLTQDQIDEACTDENTKLPEGLTLKNDILSP
jgi:uncharacterized protein YjbI with pentapeptide repeats